MSLAHRFVTENLGVPFRVKGWGNRAYTISRICESPMFQVESVKGGHEGFIYGFKLTGDTITVEGWLMGEKVTATFSPNDVVFLGKEVAA